ncbi:MAG: dolichyl-phosphate beta-D-mannosyltransferase, partial [Flavobacteriaceae bacterium]|nr:dolichyl-phosphate beta-D-mannosyltransferase [Flavobacteriaceae bacterium]
FQIEMKFKAHSNGFKLIEIPIIFTDRTKGESKMSLSIVWEAVFGLLLLKIKKVFKF